MTAGFVVFVCSLAWAAGVAANVELCGKQQAFTPESNKNYTFNNNAWNADSSGSICTYVSGSTRSFYSLWKWTSNPPAVHAYPNAGLRSTLLPLRLEDLSALNVSLTWSMSPVSLISGASTDPNTSPDSGALTANHVQANVAFDFFADADPQAAVTATQQTYEFMIWIGQFGDAAQPIGSSTPNDPPIAVAFAGMTFTLFNGTNSNGQTVYSWLADSTVTSLDTDISPLLRYLVTAGFVPPSLYLGVVQFGSETFYADSQINFTVDGYSARLSSLNESAMTSTGIDQLPSVTRTIASSTAESSAGTLRAWETFGTCSPTGAASFMALLVLMAVVTMI